MTVGRPLYLEHITNYSSDEFRTAFDALVPSGGVIPVDNTNNLAVAPTGPVSMAVQVATGFCVVPAKSAANGKYLVEVTAPETVTIAAASAFNRVDIVVAQILDTSFSDASDTAQIVSSGVSAACKGTSSGLPPATPAGCVLLATVAVSTSASTIVSGNITDARPFTSAAGGVVLCQNQAARDALTKWPGRVVYRFDTGATETCNGSTWTAVAWSNKPLFQGSQTTAQSIANNTWTPLTIDTESVDTHSGHDNTTNPAYYTVPFAGWYRVTASVRFANNATGTRAIGIGVNNATTPTPAYLQKVGSPGAAAAYDVDITEVVSISSGNIVVMAFQNSGGALLTVGSIPRFSVEFVRPL